MGEAGTSDTAGQPTLSLSVRQYNRRRVTEALRQLGTATRAELREHAGLSRATLGTLVEELIGDGLITEDDSSERTAAGEQRADRPAKSGRGRPARHLRLTSRSGLVVGLAFGHDELWAASADLSGTVLREFKVPLPVDDSATGALDAAANALEELLVSSSRETRKALRVVVGLPCPIDSTTQRIVTNNILPGWINVRPVSEFAARTGTEVLVENDANLAALGECRYGASTELADLIYLKVSVGIGAGLVLGGRLYRGATGTAGEIGHTQANPDGSLCRCGNRGCLETIAALPAVLSALSSAHGRTLSAADLPGLISDNDVSARRVLADTGRRIGRPLADLCNALNPSAVIVGGELGGAGTLVADAVQETINRYAQPIVGDAVIARPSTLGARAEVLGAISLAISQAGGDLP